MFQVGVGKFAFFGETAEGESRCTTASGTADTAGRCQFFGPARCIVGAIGASGRFPVVGWNG